MSCCCVSVLQASKQSAVSQERVDDILQENDALRTNLAALEQVTNQEALEMNSYVIHGSMSGNRMVN